MKEYDLYIPINYNDKRPITSVKIESIRNDLIDEFRGLTVFSSVAVGYWRAHDDDAEGRLYEDQNYLFRVVADDSEKVQRFMLELKDRLESLLEQQSIFIVVRDVEIL